MPLISVNKVSKSYHSRLLLDHVSFSIERGDKIAQLIVQPCLFEAVELVDDLGDETERGDAGFGSTGR